MAKRGWSAVTAALLGFAMLDAVPAQAQLYSPKEHFHDVAAPWRGDSPAAVEARTGDGLKLKGLFWRGRDDLPLLVFFQGRSGDQRDAAHYAEPLARAGYGVLIAGYRGYGGNPGSPSEAGLNLDGIAFVRLARQLRPGAKLYALGHSLGAAVALGVAADGGVDGVLAIGAFPDLRSVAPKITRAFLPDRFSNLDAAARIRTPIVLIQGRYDDMVSLEQSRKLLGACPPGSLLLVLDKQDHRPDMAEIAAILPAILAYPGATEPLVEQARARTFAIFRKDAPAPAGSQEIRR